MTALPPSPFISDSAGVVMLPADTAAALNASPGVAAAGPNSASEVMPLEDTVAVSAHPADAATVRFWDEYDRDQKLRALYDALDPPQPPLFLRTGRITDYQPDPSLKHILKVFFAMEA